MTAQESFGVTKEDYFCHIYNVSPQGKSLFSDTADYESFLSFLEEYLLPPNKDQKVKEFTIRGKVYKGATHMPKNYSGTITLLAYSLTHDRFDLLVKYQDKKTLQRFMRSLSTRYSIYFHKKYPHQGMVFKDTYISKDIINDINILNLINDFHNNGQFSSSEEYLKGKESRWVNSEYLLSLCKKVTGKSYKDFFVQNDEVKKEVRKTPQEDLNIVSEEQSYVVITSKPGFRDFFVAGSVFLVLFTFGLKNVHNYSKAKGLPASQNQAVLSENTEVADPQPENVNSNIDEGRTFAVVASKNNSPVKIYAEESTLSSVIDEAVSGQIFEILNSSESGTIYEIRLNENLTGFMESGNLQIYQK